MTFQGLDEAYYRTPGTELSKMKEKRVRFYCGAGGGRGPLLRNQANGAGIAKHSTEPQPSR